MTLQDTDVGKETQSPHSAEKDLHPNSASLHFVKSDPERFRKTTVKECELEGGEYLAHKNALSEDMIDCILPGRIKKLGDKYTYLTPRLILGSVYDYLYRAGTERPRYGLYSYILFPIYAPRVEQFLGELFKTTSFVELISINFENLNLIYLPTQADKLSSLKPMIADGSAPPVTSFALQFYDYALAQKILAQICTAPTEAIRNVCGTDLTRGPYLFTFRHPASALSPVPPPYLFVDLSNIHERAFGEFIAAYKEQVKRTDYTDLERIDNLRLYLLNIVLTSTDWIGPIKGAIEDILHIAKDDGIGK
jgi:hypothetical protein